MGKTTRNVKRVETGPLQIGDDWPGVFIRGDNALMGFAPSLQALIKGEATPINVMMCENLLKTLMSANAHTGKPEILNAETIGDFL